MGERKRFRYLLDIETAVSACAPGQEYARPTIEDLNALAELMLDAYVGTIDYDGETIDEARQEVENYFAGVPLLSCSNVLRDRGNLASACLVGVHEDTETPYIAYVMTRAKLKRAGLARRLLAASLFDLRRAGYEQVAAWITEGNEPSERLHRGMSFKRSS